VSRALAVLRAVSERTTSRTAYVTSFPTRSSASYRESNFTVIVLKPRRRLVHGLLALFRRQSGGVTFSS
jgi:hypothetical protein